MHKTLQRQVERVFGKDVELPGQVLELLKLVGETYKHFDDDRDLMDRSLELTSREMSEKTMQLEQDLKALREGKVEIKGLEDIKKATLNLLEDLNEERSKLAVANAKNEALFRSIGDGLVVVDENGKIVLVNPAFEKLLDWSGSEVKGKMLVEVIPMLDEKGEPVPNEKRLITILLQSRSQATISTSANQFVGKNGAIPVAITSSPIILGGRVVGAVEIFRDITREKEIDRMKDEFMDIAAHDLRTPAAAIRGFISRVLDGDAGEIPAKAKELLSDAYEGNMRLINLVEDFLVVSRLERGKIKITPKPGDLTKVVETSVNGLMELAKSKGLTLEYKRVELPVCKFDEERIIQVLNNLIGNAIKFTEKGGIIIEHKVSKDEVVTNVVDTGMGIPSNLQAQVFLKYNRGDEKNTSRSGLGLGLYICKLCVEGSGGKIWLESKEGVGSTFSFSLPIAKQVEPNIIK